MSINTIALACIILCFGVEHDDAVDILEKHFATGGGTDLPGIVEAFMDTLADSKYFTTAFALDAQEQDVKKGAKAKSKATQN